MTTDDLIARLARETIAVPRHARGRRLAAGFGAGGAVTLALVAAVLGIRPDLGAAMHGFPFWMKWAYTTALGIGAVALAARLARPEPVRLARFWPVALPVAPLAVVAIAEMMRAPGGARPAMWLGATSAICPWLVATLAMPILAGLFWSFRSLAPTRLRAAGAAAGLAAGAWAAALYCLHCPEMSAMFVLSWYTLGILLAAGLGALAGPRLLRW